MARLRRRSSGSHIWKWVGVSLAAVVVTIIGGYVYVQHRPSTASKMPSTTCGDYRHALTTVLAVPKPGTAADVAAIKELSASDQTKISSSISSFVSSAQQTGQRQYAAAEAEYNAQLVLGPHPSAVLPTPPRPLSAYVGFAAQAEIPSWRVWAAKAKAAMIKDNGC